MWLGINVSGGECFSDKLNDEVTCGSGGGKMEVMKEMKSCG